MDGITDSMRQESKLREILKDREAWSAAVHVVAKVLDMNNNFPEIRNINPPLLFI